MEAERGAGAKEEALVAVMLTVAVVREGAPAGAAALLVDVGGVSGSGVEGGPPRLSCCCCGFVVVVVVVAVFVAIVGLALQQ